MVVGGVWVTGAQLEGTLAREARQVDQLEHCLCLGSDRHSADNQCVTALPYRFQELAMD